ncbi:hypothetical protein [Paraburkholderia strydomiana]
MQKPQQISSIRWSRKHFYLFENSIWPTVRISRLGERTKPTYCGPPIFSISDIREPRAYIQQRKQHDPSPPLASPALSA